MLQHTGQRPKAKGQRPKAKGQRPKAKGQRPKTKDQRPKTKGQGPEAADGAPAPRQCRVTNHESRITNHESMIEQTSFLEYWPSVRSRTRRLIPLVPPDKLEWSAGEGRWTFGDTIRHLAGIERWMYAETMHGRPTRYPGHTNDLAEGVDAVLAYHDRCHAESIALLRELTPEQWVGNGHARRHEHHDMEVGESDGRA